MNNFYEAVSVTEAPEREGVYDTELGQLEFEKNADDGPGWYDREFDKYKRPKYWLRPLPVPEGTLTDDQIGDAADDYAKDGDEAGAGASGFESGAMWVNKKYLPLIASQQAEIERLTNQSNEQQKTLYDNYKLLKRFYDHLDTFGSVFPGNSKEAEAISQQELFSAYKQHRINNNPTPHP